MTKADLINLADEMAYKLGRELVGVKAELGKDWILKAPPEARLSLIASASAIGALQIMWLHMAQTLAGDVPPAPIDMTYGEPADADHTDAERDVPPEADGGRSD